MKKAILVKYQLKEIIKIMDDCAKASGTYATACIYGNESTHRETISDMVNECDSNMSYLLDYPTFASSINNVLSLDVIANALCTVIQARDRLNELIVKDNLNYHIKFLTFNQYFNTVEIQ